jgi:uncharacterized protein (UPF0248 family)
MKNVLDKNKWYGVDKFSNLKIIDNQSLLFGKLEENNLKAVDLKDITEYKGITYVSGKNAFRIAYKNGLTHLGKVLLDNNYVKN